MDPCHVARTIASKPGPATAELRHEHEVILRALAVLERAGARLELGRTVDETALQELVALIRMFADRCHHGKEEDQLFPILRAKGLGDSLVPFLDDHVEGRGYLVTLASAASPAARAAAARRYVGLLRDHIQREDDVLFPLAEEVLTPAEQGRLADAYAEVEERVVGVGVHERLLADLERLEQAFPEGK